MKKRGIIVLVFIFLALILIQRYFTSNMNFVGVYQSVYYPTQKVKINGDGTYQLINGDTIEILHWDNELSLIGISDNDICLHEYHTPNQVERSILFLSKVGNDLGSNIDGGYILFNKIQ